MGSAALSDECFVVHQSRGLSLAKTTLAIFLYAPMRPGRLSLLRPRPPPRRLLDRFDLFFPRTSKRLWEPALFGIMSPLHDRATKHD